MAQGFYGADPEQLRALAKQFSSGSNQIRSSLETVSSLVNSTQSWQGPDAGAFQQRWNSQIKQLGNTVVHALELGSTTLIKNADEQTATSQVDGGAGSNGSPGSNGNPGSNDGPGGNGGPKAPGEPGFSLSDAWEKYNKLKLGIDLPKGIYGLAWMKAHGLNILDHADWAQIPGRSGPYKLMDTASDILGGKNLSKYFPSLNIADDVLNSSTGLAGAKNTMLDFLGKGGIGKGLGAVGIGLDGIDTVKKLSEGNMGGAAWSAAKTTLGIIALSPTPIGLVAGGVSLGIAAYENIPAVKNFVDGGAKIVGDAATSAAKEVSNFSKDVGNNIKDAGEGVKNFLGL
ncbi:WXG100 family type VII secretion target [Agreia pratensis]|uniref:WXG100 family type VII secretion target n=1 Tax=Agreia pratensis TaxID=150121 RepID=UPI00188A1514|nr:WXG100 family type VII secretion target [Agreia pratensis]MBF4634890.1 WXG100 family type VII secretion target [Agreia pratensis]